MSWRSYVAVGDSFTEGLDDPYPDAVQFRGWADLLAARLAADVPDLRYANLAIRGKLLDSVIDSQVPVAMRLRPDLVSFAAGGNDALRRNFNGDRLAQRLEQVVKLLRDNGSDLLIFRFANVTARLPGRRLILPRLTMFNDIAGELADRYGARLVDLWADDEFLDPALWSVDRLHMNAYGHRRVAAHVATALGIEPDPEWWELPGPRSPVRWASRRAADAQWARAHLAPWVRRRLTGQSSGDQRVAKRPDLTPVRE